MVSNTDGKFIDSNGQEYEILPLITDYEDPGSFPNITALFMKPDGNAFSIPIINDATWNAMIIEQYSFGTGMGASVVQRALGVGGTMFSRTGAVNSSGVPVFTNVFNSPKYMTLDTSQTVTGQKKFEDYCVVLNDHVDFITNDIDVNSTSTSAKYGYINGKDKNGSLVGAIGFWQNTDGSTGAYLQANHGSAWGGNLGIVTKSGTSDVRAYAPSPKDNANDDSIATTWWTKNKCTAYAAKQLIYANVDNVTLTSGTGTGTLTNALSSGIYVVTAWWSNNIYSGVLAVTSSANKSTCMMGSVEDSDLGISWIIYTRNTKTVYYTTNGGPPNYTVDVSFYKVSDIF